MFILYSSISCFKFISWQILAAEKNNGATRIVKFSGDKVSLHNPISAGSTKVYTYVINCFYVIKTSLWKATITIHQQS